MKTSVEFDPSYAMLTVDLDPGEAIKAEPGAMVLQKGVEMKTGTGVGGLFGGFKRMLGGESFFVNTFTAEGGGGQVSLAPNSPGDIGSFDLHPGRTSSCNRVLSSPAPKTYKPTRNFRASKASSAGRACFSSGFTPRREWEPSTTTPTAP